MKKCTICSFKARTNTDLKRHMYLAHAVLVVMILGILLFLSGCHSRFTGDSPAKEDKTANVSGVWHGKIDLNGTLANLDLILIQHGGSITANSPIDYSFMTINTSQYGYTRLNGSVYDTTVSMTGTEEPAACVNNWTLNAELTGGFMMLHVRTHGNNVPGTDCYPNVLDQTIVLNH